MKNNIKSVHDALRALQNASESVKTLVNELKPNMTVEQVAHFEEKMTIPSDLMSNMDKFKTPEDVTEFIKKYNL